MADRIIVIFSLVSVVICGISGVSQNRGWSSLDGQIDRLASPSRSVRSQAFKSIGQFLPPPKGDYSHLQDLAFGDAVAQLVPVTAEKLKTALIATLAKEQKLNDGPRGEDDYYWPLLFDIASLVDQRTLPLLLKELQSGDIVDRGVARLGPNAVPAVIAQADDPHGDELNRAPCPHVLAEMLNMRTVTLEDNPHEFQLIKAAALRWVTADEFAIGISDAILLAQINDPDTIAALKEMAAEDPHAYVRSDGATERPVRHTAQLELTELGDKAGKGYFPRPY